MEMDTKQHAAAQVEKPTPTMHLEDKTELSSDKHATFPVNADYTGAEAKTDPAEIALVRKIDWRLMVRTYPPSGILSYLGVDVH
jgi:hypothetical protein